MALVYSFKRGGRFLFCRLTGRLSNGIVKAHAEDVCRQRDLGEVRAALYDFRNADEVLADHEGLRAAVNTFERNVDEFASFERHAVVVANSDVMFGLARTFQQFAVKLPWQTEVFNDLADAQDWIDSVL